MHHIRLKMKQICLTNQFQFMYVYVCTPKSTKI